LLGRYAAILGETIVAIDLHANHQLGVFGFPEVHASQRISVSQIYIDVRVERSLRSASQFILGAVAPGAVGAKQGIQSLFKCGQRLLFAEASGKNKALDVGSAASVREFRIPEVPRVGGCADNSQQNKSTECQTSDEDSSLCH
jgi:hypothetical protein